MSSNHTEISRLHTSYSHTQQVLIEMADLLGHKWHPVILQQLVATEECGFSDLHAAIDDISNKMLSDSLTTLEEHGLVERVVVSEKPVRVRYSLTDRGRELDVVEIPVSWQRDDWPALTFTWSRPHRMGYVSEDSLFRRYYDQFDWMHEHVDDGVFILTMHPQVMGQAHRITRLEEFVQHIEQKDDVEFKEMDTVASEFRANN